MTDGSLALVVPLHTGLGAPVDTGWSWWRRWAELVAAIRARHEARATATRPPGADRATPLVDGTTIGLDALMTEHAEAAYRVALSITRDHDLAQDATQEAMLKAWTALPSWRGDAPLRNWVLRITHNTAITLLRKRREVIQDPVDVPEVSGPASVERDVQDRLAMQAFARALDELDELTRSIVVLREVEQLSYDEIADTLDVPLPTVKTRLLRARRQLAVAMEAWRP